MEIYFASDYAEGAHPKILERLFEINLEKNPGYGLDIYCESARQKIREACACSNADIYFLVGGTQTNQTVIDAMLPRYAGVLATETGHVSVHEAGAIEFTGHKVLPLSSHDGKIDAADIRRWFLAFYADGNHDHMVFPGMVYISHPTEYGTLYAKDELIGIRDVCNEYKIPLYLDGARLGYGLACPSADVTLKDIAALTDVFYIGGTKVGALFGEAVVFTRHNAPDHFITIAKQHGALLAKGWLLGIQFETLFSDGLYEQLGRNAVMQADMIRKALQDKGYHIHMASPTNQIFLELDDQRLEDLQRHVAVSFWEKTDRGHTVVRLATSWATTDAQVSELLRHL